MFEITVHHQLTEKSFPNLKNQNQYIDFFIGENQGLGNVNYFQDFFHNTQIYIQTNMDIWLILCLIVFFESSRA